MRDGAGLCHLERLGAYAVEAAHGEATVVHCTGGRHPCVVSPSAVVGGSVVGVVRPL